MTRHDEPAEGDVAGLEQVIEKAIAVMPVRNRQEASAVAWLLVNTLIATHVADALRDLLAAAEQRGRVAALVPVKQLAREWDLTEFPDEHTAATMRLDLTRSLSATELAQ